MMFRPWTLFFLLAVTAPTTTATNLAENDNNAIFDPKTAEQDFCNIPPYQDEENSWTPPQAAGLCANITDDILEDLPALQALAEAYAPFLYFHPRERYTMSSVERTFADPTKGRIYLNHNGLKLYDPELTPFSLQATTRDRNEVMHSHRFYFEHDLDNDYKGGDGFTEEGISRAPIYYRAYDSGNGTLTINYFMYYTWNGAAQLGVMTSYNRPFSYIRFRVPPIGVHEGDWESMSVTVCKSDIVSQPLALTYRQHDFGQVLDCTAGECMFQKDYPTHPVGFVALATHGVYPFTAKEVVRTEIWPIEFFLNLQGVYIVDRVRFRNSLRQYRYYQPDETNVIRLAEQQDIPHNVSESEWWGAFGGNWGSGGEAPELSDETFDELFGEEAICINEEDEEIECPDAEAEPVFRTVLEALGIFNTTSSIVSSARKIRQFIQNIFRDAQGPYGPASTPYYDLFRPPGNAHLWSLPVIETNETGEIYCERQLNSTDPDYIYSDVSVIPLTKNIIGIICMCVFFTLFNIFYFLRKRHEDVRPVLLTDEDGRYLAPDRSTRKWVYLHAWVYTGAYALTLVGALLFFVGYSALTSLLEETFSGINFKAIEALFLALGFFILLIDTFLLIILWLRTEDLWRRINITYYKIVGEAAARRFDPFDKICCYSPEVVDVMYLVTFALLLVSLILAVIMLIVAIFNVGFAYAFGKICEDTLGSLDGICFRFDALGVEDIQCGGEFQAFCNEWNRRDMSATLWGAFVVICGHFYLIAAGGMVALSNRSVNRALLLYPTNEEYLKYLDKLDSVGESFKESQKPKEEPKQNGNSEVGTYLSGFFNSIFQRSAPPVEQLEEAPLDESTPPLDYSKADDVVDVDTPTPSDSHQ